MIRTEWQADAEYFADKAAYVRTAADERANLLRCLAEDIAEARREYVLRRSHIGRTNKAKGMFAAGDKSMAFKMFNKARAKLNRAEKAMAVAMQG